MAKFFVKTINSQKVSQQACLKIYRDKDNKELSIAFDNSCGVMGSELKRIEACIFPDN
jgi:hypothetical protein